MDMEGDGELYSYRKLRFLRAAWQPACRSCRPLSVRRSRLFPWLSCPFHPPRLPFIAFSLSAPAQS